MLRRHSAADPALATQLRCLARYAATQRTQLRSYARIPFLRMDASIPFLRMDASIPFLRMDARIPFLRMDAS